MSKNKFFIKYIAWNYFKSPFNGCSHISRTPCIIYKYNKFLILPFFFDFNVILTDAFRMHRQSITAWVGRCHYSVTITRRDSNLTGVRGKGERACDPRPETVTLRGMAEVHRGGPAVVGTWRGHRCDRRMWLFGIASCRRARLLRFGQIVAWAGCKSRS